MTLNQIKEAINRKLGRHILHIWPEWTEVSRTKQDEPIIYYERRCECGKLGKLERYVTLELW
jgi:hypothetical protein